MSKLSIFTIKQIIDVVCDELSREDRELPNHVITLEEQLKRKEDEIQVLYKENSNLEQRIRELENDLDVLMKVGKLSEDSKDSHEIQEIQEIQEKGDEESKVKPSPITQEEKKQQRKEYLREYRRNYRKRQREKKLEFNM